MERRETCDVYLPPSEIKSGDLFLCTRLDGLDPLHMQFTGGRVGHTALAQWIDGELYIIESTAGWYWPKNGIQKTKYHEWLRLAKAADFIVARLQLKSE